MINCLMVVKDEADRFLDSVLAHHSKLVDNICVVDDGSIDDTVEIARSYTDCVLERPPSVPSFTEDEASFRQWAWNAAGRCLEMVEDEWLLLIDADEFYMPVLGLDEITMDAANLDVEAVTFRMPEIWSADAGLWIRADGFWNKNKNVRLVRFHKDARFALGVMGGGSVPTDYRRGRQFETNDVILHFGYLYPQDRVEKYERYRSLANLHSSSHIESIITVPTLQQWNGTVPTWWRGQSG